MTRVSNKFDVLGDGMSQVEEDTQVKVSVEEDVTKKR